MVLTGIVGTDIVTLGIVKRSKPIYMPIWLSRTLLCGLSLILIVMPIHAFVSTWGGTAIGPLWAWKSWKELLLVFLVALTLGWMATKPMLLRRLVKDPLAVAIVAYLMFSLALTCAFWSQDTSDATLAGLAMNLRYIGVGALAYLLFAYGQLSSRWLERGYWYVVCAGVFVAILGILQVLVVPGDALGTFGYNKESTIAPSVVIDDQPGMYRAFATLRGPNDFGAFLILPILLVVMHIRRLPRWVSLTMLSFMVTALLLSGSRSAWLGMLCAFGLYGFYVAGKRASRQLIIMSSIALLLIAAVGMYAAVNIPLLRQAIFHSSPGDVSLTEGSTDQHIAATVAGAERVVDEPLGCGVGCAGPASYYGDSARISENYFVQIAEEVGILGLLLFLMVVGLVAYRLYRNTQLRGISGVLLAALVGYGIIGMLLHVWSDDPLSITWWMLAGAAIGYNESNTWIKSKNSSRSKT